MSRLSPRDEVAASVEVWQLWQRVKGYTDPAAAFNPFDASIATGTDRTNLVKIGGQWTHLFGTSVEANINGGWVQSFGTQSGIVATVTGDGTIVPDDRQPGLVRIWRPARLPHHQGLGRRSLPQRHRRPAAGRQHASWRRGVAGHVIERSVGWAKRTCAVPTISRQTVIVNGGHASLCPPYEFPRSYAALLPSYARFRPSISSLTMPIIACIARCAPAASAPPRYVINAVGTICHDTP